MKAAFIITTILSAVVAATDFPGNEDELVARGGISPDRGAAGHVTASLWSVAGLAAAAAVLI